MGLLRYVKNISCVGIPSRWEWLNNTVASEAGRWQSEL